MKRICPLVLSVVTLTARVAVSSVEFSKHVHVHVCCRALRLPDLLLKVLQTKKKTKAESPTPPADPPGTGDKAKDKSKEPKGRVDRSRSPKRSGELPEVSAEAAEAAQKRQQEAAAKEAAEEEAKRRKAGTESASSGAQSG